MSIGYAVQKGTLIYIYDHNGKQITSVSAPGRWPEDGLKGFSPNAINVQKGTLIYHYDETGHMIGRPLPAQQPTHANHQTKHLLSA
ncbi:hypothetical protein SAMN05660964_03129 [Thiothrix caldifontis]|jgi:hypothetical protein|uniref:YD repeat-containing protein n=1 Tax=Thiothrix caldifontis TaxID=525918 RepID=A0A1H4FTY9_9GAMM|nr:hypothetical protein [Thiothrix caldifontis]SEB00786.1 hypothetical protein SAMN05660964_03129 [Thiothrix caldifontis]